MQRVAPVRGRLERAVISKSGAPVYVDYAHTADALEAAIAALRPHVEGAQLITVFGAGGDRDQGKRPEMGAVASAAQRRRHRHRRQSARRGPGRDPQGDHGRGTRRDRGRADGARRSPRRFGIAKAGDIVLLAGKGHETGQIIGAGATAVLPFDDVLVARECAA